MLYESLRTAVLKWTGNESASEFSLVVRAVTDLQSYFGIEKQMDGYMKDLMSIRDNTPKKAAKKG